MNRFETFNFEKCRDLEIGVKGHSRLPEPTHTDPTHPRLPANVP